MNNVLNYENIKTVTDLLVNYNKLYENDKLKYYLHFIISKSYNSQATRLIYDATLFDHEMYIKEFMDADQIEFLKEKQLNFFNIQPFTNFMKNEVPNYKESYERIKNNFKEFIAPINPIKIVPIVKNPVHYGNTFLQTDLAECDVAISLEAILAFKKANPISIINEHFQIDETAFIIGSRKLNIYCFFIQSLQTIYVVNYGTHNIQDVLTDASIFKASFLNSYAHSGFLQRATDAYECIHDSIMSFMYYHNSFHTQMKPLRVVFAGHSLGGIVAQLLYLMFKTNYPYNNFFCVTFGAPFGVSKSISDAVLYPKEILNFIDLQDPIPFSSCLGTEAVKKAINYVTQLSLNTIMSRLNNGPIPLPEQEQDFSNMFCSFGTSYNIDNFRLHSMISLPLDNTGVLTIPKQERFQLQYIMRHAPVQYALNYYSISAGVSFDIEFKQTFDFSTFNKSTTTKKE